MQRALPFVKRGDAITESLLAGLAAKANELMPGISPAFAFHSSGRPTHTPWLDELNRIRMHARRHTTYVAYGGFVSSVPIQDYDHGTVHCVNRDVFSIIHCAEEAGYWNKTFRFLFTREASVAVVSMSAGYSMPRQAGTEACENGPTATKMPHTFSSFSFKYRCREVPVAIGLVVQVYVNSDTETNVSATATGDCELVRTYDIGDITRSMMPGWSGRSVGLVLKFEPDDGDELRSVTVTASPGCHFSFYPEDYYSQRPAHDLAIGLGRGWYGYAFYWHALDGVNLDDLPDDPPWTSVWTNLCYFDSVTFNPSVFSKAVGDGACLVLTPVEAPAVSVTGRCHKYDLGENWRPRFAVHGYIFASYNAPYFGDWVEGLGAPAVPPTYNHTNSIELTNYAGTGSLCRVVDGWNRFGAVMGTLRIGTYTPDSIGKTEAEATPVTLHAYGHYGLMTEPIDHTLTGDGDLQNLGPTRPNTILSNGTMCVTVAQWSPYCGLVFDKDQTSNDPFAAAGYHMTSGSLVTRIIVSRAGIHPQRTYAIGSSTKDAAETVTTEVGVFSSGAFIVLAEFTLLTGQPYEAFEVTWPVLDTGIPLAFRRKTGSGPVHVHAEITVNRTPYEGSHTTNLEPVSGYAGSYAELTGDRKPCPAVEHYNETVSVLSSLLAANRVNIPS